MIANLRFGFDLVEGNWIIVYFDEILFGEDEHDRFLALDLLNFVAPLVDTFQTCSVVGCDTDHEGIGVLILYLTINTEMVISTRIVDLNLNLSLLQVFGTLVDIQYGRLVIVCVLILQIIGYQA